MAYFTFVEYTQIKIAGGIGPYLSEDFWNIQDILLSISFTFYYIISVIMDYDIYSKTSSIWFSLF